MFSKYPTLAVLLASSLAACASSPPAQPSTPTDATNNESAVPPLAARGEDDRAEPGPVPIGHDDPSWGNANAPVTIVEFADFQCMFSRRAAATIHALRDKYGPDQLRVVWKHNPLPFHPLARSASEAAITAYTRGGDQPFWIYYDAVYGNSRPFSEELYREAMRLAGVPEAEVVALRSKASAKIDADIELGKRIGVNGTPAFFINGILISGAQPLDKFVAVIDQELPKAKALAAQGILPGRLYATRAAENFKNQPAPSPSPTPAPPPPEDTTVWRVPIAGSPVRGKASALVTIVEFADYQCPFCAKVEPTLAAIAKQYGSKVRFVYKDNPLPFHPRAEPASEVALEVRARRGDAAFWKFHDAVFADNQHLDDDSLALAAAQAGLDKSAALAVIQSKKHHALVDATANLAEDVQATGTPTFFINGRRLVGAQPLERFTEIIDAELARAEGMVKQGTPASALYEAIIKNGKTGEQPTAVTVPAPTAGSPSRGPTNAKIVVQYFGDFQCPFCRRAEPTLVELEKAYPGQVRVVWRNLPLPMHDRARLAAEAAMEAFAQRGSAGFWAYHDELMTDQAATDRAGLEHAAQKIGLDMPRFVRALDSHSHAAEIEADERAAATAKISGTPGFTINGYFLSGAQPFLKFKKIADYSLARKNP